MAGKNVDKIEWEIIKDFDDDYDDFNDVFEDDESDSQEPIKEKSEEIADQSLLGSATKQSKESQTEYEKRDESYTLLLGDYIDSSKSKTEWNKVYKCIFFCVTMLILVALVAFPIAVTIIIVVKEQSNLVVDIAALVGSIIGIISAIIVLPKIIAQHLFPTNEDEHMIELVKNMQVNDSKIREALKNKKK